MEKFNTLAGYANTKNLNNLQRILDVAKEDFLWDIGWFDEIHGADYRSERCSTMSLTTIRTLPGSQGYVSFPFFFISSLAITSF